MRNKRTLSHLLSGNEEEPSLNLTPLIDVVFVVLILFILIAPMLDIDKVQLASSAVKENKSTLPEAGPIAIHVREDNSIWVRSKKITIEQLLVLLKQEKASKPLQTPQLFHDKKAQFGTYQTVKNAIEMAGFEQLDVILQPGSS
ncbi:MAG: biopolymer transporter ExbD [Rhabdochlamydiaceae bacterium]|nr:biopolymer transporter ExbD [Rhabdochlamydiaceae bacterium]